MALTVPIDAVNDARRVRCTRCAHYRHGCFATHPRIDACEREGYYQRAAATLDRAAQWVALAPPTKALPS